MNLLLGGWKMKKGKMSKLMAVVVAGMMVFTGCSSGKTDQVNNESNAEKEFTIGIVQLAEHPALDGARLGFEEGLKELGVNAKVIYKNAQGDIPTSLSISQNFVNDKVDLIFAIATPAAQAAKQATIDSNIPVIFSAVTDPVSAELVASMDKPEGNVTGTSDATPIDRQLQLFKDLDPNIKNIGIIFSTSEPNSQVQIDMAKELAVGMGLEIHEVGITTINDIPQAVDSIIDSVDGIYAITDNMVASGINIVAAKAIENNIITVGAEEALVKGGLLITDGLSYFELGRQSAEMAKQILVDGKPVSEVPSASSQNTIKALNENTLKSLNLDADHVVFKNAVKVGE